MLFVNEAIIYDRYMLVTSAAIKHSSTDNTKNACTCITNFQLKNCDILRKKTINLDYVRFVLTFIGKRVLKVLSFCKIGWEKPV